MYQIHAMLKRLNEHNVLGVSMTTLFPSLEAINTQHNSPLASGLIDLFQDIMNYRDGIQTSIQDRVTNTIKYAKKKILAEFPSIVSKATGLKCKSIYFSTSMNFGYACLMDIGDKYGLNAAAVIAEYTGTGEGDFFRSVMKYYQIRCTTAKELTNLVQSLSKETGKFSENTLSDGRKVSFTLFFDIYSAFLIQECGHIKNKPFTAAEIAAIIAHEIGHMHTMLEHALDRCMRLQVATTAVEYFNKHSTTEEKLKFIKSATTSRPDVGKKVDELLASRKDTVGGYIVDAFVALLMLIVTGLGIVRIPNSILNSILSTWWNDASITRLRNRLDKTSDIANTEHNFKLMERMADEFAVKHGLGGPLITALSKLDYNIAGYAGMYCANKNSGFLWNVFRMSSFLNMLFNGYATYRMDEHDSMPTRGVVAAEKVIAILKEKLSPDLLEYYLADYESIRKVLDDPTKTEKMMTFALSFGKMISYFASTPAALLLSGRFGGELEKLIYQTNSLINNQLYYRAAKLEQLINK